MPDDFATDDALVERAHKALEALRFVPREPHTRPAEYARRCQVADAAVTELGKRLYQLREEKQAAEDIAAHAQELVLPIRGGVLELDSFLQHRTRP